MTLGDCALFFLFKDRATCQDMGFNALIAVSI